MQSSHSFTIITCHSAFNGLHLRRLDKRRGSWIIRLPILIHLLYFAHLVTRCLDDTRA